MLVDNISKSDYACHMWVPVLYAKLLTTIVSGVLLKYCVEVSQFIMQCLRNEVMEAAVQYNKLDKKNLSFTIILAYIIDWWLILQGLFEELF